MGVLSENFGLKTLDGGMCTHVWDYAKIHLKSIVYVICRIWGGEMVNSKKANPNSLLAETDRDNLERACML